MWNFIYVWMCVCKCIEVVQNKLLHFPNLVLLSSLYSVHVFVHVNMNLSSFAMKRRSRWSKHWWSEVQPWMTCISYWQTGTSHHIQATHETQHAWLACAYNVRSISIIIMPTRQRATNCKWIIMPFSTYIYYYYQQCSFKPGAVPPASSGSLSTKASLNSSREYHSKI